MGKQPSFIEIATNRLRFLADDHGFAGPEVERPADRIPAITRVCYDRGDVTIEVAHVVGFMGRTTLRRAAGARTATTKATGWRLVVTQRARATNSGAHLTSKHRQSARTWFEPAGHDYDELTHHRTGELVDGGVGQMIRT
jgi:hypothetical protein